MQNTGFGHNYFTVNTKIRVANTDILIFVLINYNNLHHAKLNQRKINNETIPIFFFKLIFSVRVRVFIVSALFIHQWEAIQVLNNSCKNYTADF